MKTIHEGEVKNGRFIPDDKTAFKCAFGCLEGKRVDVTVSRHRKARSKNQNAYYWGVVLPMIQESGGYALSEEAHEACKWALLKQRDRKAEYCRSTATLSTVEMEEYLSRIRQLASEGHFGDGVWIPEPNETEYNYKLEKPDNAKNKL